MGYMDVQAWKNMLSSVSQLASPSDQGDHIEFWYTQPEPGQLQGQLVPRGTGLYVFSKSNNTKTHIGDEIDFTWTHMLLDGKWPSRPPMATCSPADTSRRTWVPAAISNGPTSTLDELLRAEA